MVLRSFIFAAERSRLGKRTPSPQAAFKATNDAIARWLVQHGESLVWPSLAEVHDTLNELQQSDCFIAGKA